MGGHKHDCATFATLESQYLALTSRSENNGEEEGDGEGVED